MFWLMLGVSLGVYFQARTDFKKITAPIVEVFLYALSVGLVVYTLYILGISIKEYF